jgi:hypothetical protein
MTTILTGDSEVQYDQAQQLDRSMSKDCAELLRWRPLEDFNVTATYEIFASNSSIPPLTT